MAPSRPRRRAGRRPARLAAALALATTLAAAAPGEPLRRPGDLRDAHRPGPHGAAAQTLRRQRAELDHYRERVRLEARSDLREQAREGRRRVESQPAFDLSDEEVERLRRRWRREDRLDELADRADARAADVRLGTRTGPVTRRVFEESDLDLRALLRARETERRGEELAHEAAREAARDAQAPGLWERLTRRFRP